MTSFLLSCAMPPFKIGSILKGKNLLLESTLNEMGGENEDKRVASPVSVPIHLNVFTAEELFKD